MTEQTLTPEQRKQMKQLIIMVTVGLLLIVISWCILDTMNRNLPDDPSIKMWEATSSNVMVAVIVIAAIAAGSVGFLMYWFSPNPQLNNTDKSES